MQTIESALEINLFLRIAFAPVARAAALQGKGGIIHFEVQPKNVNKVVDAQLPILGDVVTNLASLVPLIEGSPRTEWFSEIKGWKEAWPFTYSKKDSKRVKPQAVIEELDKLTKSNKENVIITTGVGQHQMWAAQFFRWTHPRTMVTSGGLGVRSLPLGVVVLLLTDARRQWALACLALSVQRWPLLRRLLSTSTVMPRLA